MKLKSAYRIITVTTGFLLFPSLSAFAAQAVDGNVTTVNGVVYGSVCGNTGGTNTLLSGPNVPLAGDPRDVTNNKVIIETSGTVIPGYPGGVYGGYTKGSGNVTGNEVVVRNGGYVGGYAYGGYSLGGGATAGNTLVIEDGGGVDAYAYGGFSSGGSGPGGDVTGNTVIVANGAAAGVAYGGFNAGYASTGNVTGNTVVVNGYVIVEAIGGVSQGQGNVTGNTVDVNGRVTSAMGGVAHRDGDVSGNAVSIGGAVSEALGGYSLGNGNVTGNTVDVSGSADYATGGFTHGDGNVTGNAVTIGGTVLEAYGGYSVGSGNVSGNTVDIVGTVDSNVYGGYIVQSSSAADVAGNTVNLHQGASITGGIYGGITYGTGIASGNTLGVRQFRGSVGEVNAFQNYNFELPPGLYAGDTLITVTGGTPTDLNGSTIAVSNYFSPGAFSNSGDTITLISQANGSFTTDFPGTAYGGLSQIYSLDLHANSGALVLEATKVAVNPQTKALAQGIISEVLTLNRASDLLTGAGLEQAEASLKKQGGGMAAFASTSYADTRTKTGSHIDADGWAGLTGLAWKEHTSTDTGLLAGLFIENGHGKFSAYNDFSGQSSVSSSGDTDYVGAGVMGHYRFVNRIRLEASARFGHVESDYTAGGYAGGLRPKYDLEGMYHGAHVGAGYDRDLTDTINLDLVARYLWTHREGETVKILDEEVRFDNIDSHRIRAGGRLTYEPAPALSPFIGLYGEYEFDGEAGAHNKAANVRHEPLKIKGTTCIGEIGVSNAPEAIANLSVDLSLQGHAGRRDGVVGNFALSWKF